MGEHVLGGNPPVAVTLRQSARARRISLRVSRLDGQITLTVPKGVSTQEALSFADEKSDWIRKHLAARPADRRVAIGGSILFEGQEVDILAGRVRAAKLIDGQLVVPASESMVTPRVVAFLKARARARLTEVSTRYAAQVGRPFGRISIRDTRSRWGSCSSEGNLMYSWRLVMAPPEALEYVAAHEVCHLVHMDHSDRFWGAVQAIYPDYKIQRNWLRKNGEQLHQWVFKD